MTRSLFRYYGGKYRLAKWIIGHFPEHDIYIEPYAGAASVFMQKKRCFSELLNDRNSEITTFFEILRDDKQREALKKKLLMTPYSRDEYDKAHFQTDDRIEKTRRFLIRSLMGFSADSVNLENSKSGFRSYLKPERGSIPSHEFASYPSCFDQFAARLKGVIIENIDAIKLIDKYKNQQNILWYFDPPYPPETRTRAQDHKYVYEMTPEEHEELIERILELKGMVIISSYDNPIYQKLENFGWHKETKTYRNNIFNSGSRSECIWLNQACLSQEVFNFETEVSS